jgi:hypothetical protein
MNLVPVASSQVGALPERGQVARQAGDEAVFRTAAVVRLGAAGGAGEVGGEGMAPDQHVAIGGQRQGVDEVTGTSPQIGALDQRIDRERMAPVVRTEGETVG